MNTHMYMAFSRELVELQKEANFIKQTAQKGVDFVAHHAAQLGRGAEKATVESAKIMRDSVDPRYMKKGLSEGLEAMGNMHPEKLRSMEKLQAGGRGMLNKKLDFFRSAEGIEASKQKARAIGNAYKSDYHTGTGAMDWARRKGIMSGAAKYEGDSVIRKGLNTVRRALPGEAAVQVGMGGQQAYHNMKTTEDPTTGRQIGLGERMGRAGVGFTSGIVGMRAGTGGTGLAAGMITGMAGESLGGMAGRGVDKAFGAAKAAKNRLQPHQTHTGAAPAPTGAS
jgi:hypothetical protein